MCGVLRLDIVCSEQIKTQFSHMCTLLKGILVQAKSLGKASSATLLSDDYGGGDDGDG